MAKILFNFSGSIAAYKALFVVSEMVKAGHEVQTVQTVSSQKFIGAASLEGLTGKKVLSDTFEPGSMMAHIHEVDKNEMQILAPASLNTLVKMSLGFADDLVGALFQARDPNKKYLIFPAMNHRMWESSPCQQAVQKLRAMKNIQVYEPGLGHQACGHAGAGRLLEPEAMSDLILHELRSTSDKKVLLVFGGTREALDSVRSIGNSSSGQTGLQIYKDLRHHFNLDLCASNYLKRDLNFVSNENKSFFTDFKSLNALMEEKLTSNKYRSIIFMPAVSDYSVHHIEGVGSTENSKISSDMSSLKIELKSNFKILPFLKKWQPGVQVIGFKLTAKNPKPMAKISKVAEYSDFVVHNDVSGISEVSHQFEIYNSSLAVIDRGKTKSDMAQSLINIMAHSHGSSS